ncbi:MAG TPA: hypothetical protein VGT98_14010 [Candidatus Elarobacter sp.]|nr:hypothetical protein [Candidatus Elarobacter sp.]
MTNNDPLMDDDAVGDSVLRYVDEHPELLSDIEPAHDLWPGIESRIEARVLPLASSGSAPAVAVHATRRRFTWIPMAAAAAALVVTTAGVTYVLTRNASAVPGSAPAVASGTPATTTTLQPTPSATPDVGTSVATVGTAAPSTDDGARKGVARTPRASAQLASQPSERDEMRSDYDREITTLRAALDARRTQLDPATVATVEQNLQVIDNAIRQAKAALAKDPKSRFLNDQLDRTLAKKTDLLRAAALLPSA